MRRVLYPLRLARARLGAGRPLVLLAAVGMAAGTGVLAAVLAGSLVARDTSLSYAIDDLDSQSQAVRAVAYGVPGQLIERYDDLDAQVRTELARVVDRKPTAIVLYRESTVADEFIGLGAVDGLAEWVELESGRLPRACRPERCEVLLMRGEGAIPNAPGLRLVVVGTARIASGVLFGDFLAPDENDRLEAAPQGAGNGEAPRYHEAPPPPLVLAEGVEGLVASPLLSTVYRSLGWVVPLSDGGVHVWEIARVRSAVTRARSSLKALSTTFDVLAPTEELDSARRTSEAGGRRLLLVGGEVAALLFAFAVLAAMSLRPDAAASRRRLVWAGARGWQLWLVTAAEALALGTLGTAAGWAIGCGAGAAIAASTDAPVGDVLSHSVLSPAGLAIGAGAAALAGAVVLAVLAAPSVGLRGRRISPLDVAALAALALAVLAFARGDLDRDTLAREKGTGPLLTLLPALVTFAGAVAAARAFPPLTRALSRATRRRSLSLRLALVSLARDPARGAVALAVFVVSLSLALFAASYRTTLARGQTEQAAFDVPLDFVVQEDLHRLLPVLDAAPLERFRTLGDDVDVVPVTRLAGSIPRLGTSGATVLGIDAETIPRIEGWRDDFSALSLSGIAERVTPDRSTALHGVAIPADATALVLAAEGKAITIRATIEAPAGNFETVELGSTEDTLAGELRVDLPTEVRGGTLVGLTIRPPKRLVEGGSSNGRGYEGTAQLGPLRAETPAGDVELTRYEAWVGAKGLVPSGGELTFTLTNQDTSWFRPSQPFDGYRIPVVATSRLAAAAGDGGVLPVRINGVELVAELAGVVERFPGVDGDVLLADRAGLAAALNTARPGSGLTNEVWLGAPDERRDALAAELAEPPFATLHVTSRADAEQALRREPLAHGILLTLGGAALIGLALALAGLALSVLGDLRDDRRTFLDLEAQGARPALLRRVVEARAGLLVGLGTAGGLAAGVVLGALVVSLVALTAGAAEAEPPLHLAVDWPIVAAALACYVAAVTAVVIAATRLAFRGSTAQGEL